MLLNFSIDILAIILFIAAKLEFNSILVLLILRFDFLHLQMATVPSLTPGNQLKYSATSPANCSAYRNVVGPQD